MSEFNHELIKTQVILSPEKRVQLVENDVKEVQQLDIVVINLSRDHISSLILTAKYQNQWKTSEPYISDGNTQYSKFKHTNWLPIVGIKPEFHNIAPGETQRMDFIVWDIPRTDGIQNIVIASMFGSLPNGQTFGYVRDDLKYTWQRKWCFVATAAYRNSDHPIVQEFRTLRDGILINFKVGRKFIDWYYNNGPYAAEVIERHPIFQKAARLILTPVAETVRAIRRLIDRSPRLRCIFYDYNKE